MKQIRTAIFETNSSSTHSICITSESEYNKWISGDNLYSDWKEKLVPKAEGMEKLREHYPDPETMFEKFGSEEEALAYIGLYTKEKYDENVEDRYLEEFVEKYTPAEGENIIAFGYYGHEC